MRAFLTTLVALVLLFDIAIASADDWKEFKASEGNFKVLVPAEPEFEFTQMLLPDEMGRLDQYAYSSLGKSEAVKELPLFTSYQVVFSHLTALRLKTAKPDQILIDDRDESIQSTKAERGQDTKLEVVKDRAIVLAKYPGRELEFKVYENGKLTLIWRSRTYVVENRLYGLLVIKDPNDDNDKFTQKFFDSFSLLGPAPTGDPTKLASYGFNVKLPGEVIHTVARCTNGTAKALENARLNVFLVELDLDTLNYTVMLHDFSDERIKSKGTDEILTEVGKALVKDVRGTLQSETKLALSGHPGRELNFTSKLSGKLTTYQWRIYVVGNRLYQVGIAREEKPINAVAAKKFFDSFELVKDLPAK